MKGKAIKEIVEVMVSKMAKWKINISHSNFVILPMFIVEKGQEEKRGVKEVV